MNSREVRVEAKPGASRERVEKIGEHRYRIAVKEDAQAGAANARIRELIAQAYGVRPARVRLRTGVRSVHKRFDVILP
jgi:uncharacterized protein YggU (UPF0235/DUF167 family)